MFFHIFLRYTSPTDLMMSPITKGLLARTKRGGGGGVLRDCSLKDGGTYQNKFPMQFDEKKINTTGVSASKNF